MHFLQLVVTKRSFDQNIFFEKEIQLCFDIQ